MIKAKDTHNLIEAKKYQGIKPNKCEQENWEL